MCGFSRVFSRYFILRDREKVLTALLVCIVLGYLVLLCRKIPGMVVLVTMLHCMIRILG